MKVGRREGIVEERKKGESEGWEEGQSGRNKRKGEREEGEVN